MSRNPRNQSLGEVISSITFFGFGFWLILEARSLMQEVSLVQVIGLHISGILCILASLRFAIARVFSEFGKRRK